MTKGIDLKGTDHRLLFHKNRAIFFSLCEPHHILPCSVTFDDMCLESKSFNQQMLLTT